MGQKMKIEQFEKGMFTQLFIIFLFKIFFGEITVEFIIGATLGLFSMILLFNFIKNLKRKNNE